MEKKAIKTDEEKIKNALQKELSFADRFQPFLDEFFLNEYTFTRADTRWQTIRDIIFHGTLDIFMREQALLRSPYFNTMPVKREMQLNLVDVDVIYPNYYNLQTLFAGIQSLPFIIRGKINSFYLNAKNKLALSDSFIQKVRDENTIYGNAKQYEVFNTLTSLLESAKRIQKESGISIFSNGVVVNSEFGNLLNAEINANRIIHQN